MAAKLGTVQDKLNKLAPIAKKAGLGDVLVDLVTQVNSLTTAHNALAAKLDADTGVADTDYSSAAGVTATAIKTIEQRG